MKEWWIRIWESQGNLQFLTLGGDWKCINNFTYLTCLIKGLSALIKYVTETYKSWLLCIDLPSGKACASEKRLGLMSRLSIKGCSCKIVHLFTDISWPDGEVGYILLCFYSLSLRNLNISTSVILDLQRQSWARGWPCHLLPLVSSRQGRIT